MQLARADGHLGTCDATRSSFRARKRPPPSLGVRRSHRTRTRSAKLQSAAPRRREEPSPPLPTRRSLLAWTSTGSRRRASRSLLLFARRGTPQIHVDDAGAGGRPEYRKHAQAQARGGLTTVAVLTDPSPHNPELYGRMSAVAMAACDRARERIAKRPREAESSVGAVHCPALRLKPLDGYTVGMPKPERIAQAGLVGWLKAIADSVAPRAASRGPCIRGTAARRDWCRVLPSLSLLRREYDRAHDQLRSELIGRRRSARPAASRAGGGAVACWSSHRRRARIPRGRP
jgi:hypothetical protein